MVVITLAHTGKTKKTHVSPFIGKKEDVEYFTLSQYIDIVKKCIAAFCTRSMASSMLNDEDAISFMVEELIVGTAAFNNHGSLQGYLCLRAKWGIKRWVALQKKSVRNYSLDYVPENHTKTLYESVMDPNSPDPTNNTEQNYYDSVSNIMNLITERQRECLSMYLLDGLRQTDIARKLGISREAVRQHLNNGLTKIKNSEVTLAI